MGSQHYDEVLGSYLSTAGGPRRTSAGPGSSSSPRCRYRRTGCRRRSQGGPHPDTAQFSWSVSPRSTTAGGCRWRPRSPTPTAGSPSRTARPGMARCGCGCGYRDDHRRRVRDHHGEPDVVDRPDGSHDRTGGPPRHADVDIRPSHDHVRRRRQRRAYPNHQVVVQTGIRGVPAATFRTVATARTTATGY
jgi:hypothetical protein